jgi:hypothetical protein
MTAQDENNPRHELARTVLEAGIIKLGKDLQEHPEDERLQKAAERLILYAPELLSEFAHSKQPASSKKFIETGVEHATKSVGGALQKLEEKKPLPEIKLATDDDGKKHQQLSSIAAKVTTYPHVEVDKYTRSTEGKHFLIAGALEESEAGAKTRDRISDALTANPANANLHEVAASVVAYTPPPDNALLSKALFDGAFAYLGSDTFREKPDTDLLGRILSAVSTDRASEIKLPDDVLSMLTLANIKASVPAQQLPQVLANTLAMVPNASLSKLDPALVAAITDGLQKGMFSPDAISQAADKLLKLVPTDALATNDALAKSLASGVLKIGNFSDLDPTNAAKLLLGTPSVELNKIPWELIKEVFGFMLKLDRSSPIYAKLKDKIKDYPDIETLARSLPEELRAAIPELAKKLEGSEQISEAVTKILTTPIEEMHTIDTRVIEQAIKQVGESPEVNFNPELAAKIMQGVTVEQLKNIPETFRKQAISYLSNKDETTATDAELAARIVASTPMEQFDTLNKSILTLAATIAKSNVSFADRDSLVEVIESELKKIAAGKEDDEEKDREKDKEKKEKEKDEQLDQEEKIDQNTTQSVMKKRKFF